MASDKSPLVLGERSRARKLDLDVSHFVERAGLLSWRFMQRELTPGYEFAGKYRVEVSRAGKTLATARYTVGPPATP